MRLNLFLLILWFSYPILCDPIVKCNETTLTYLSNFALGQQYDLNKTFTTLQPIIKVPSFSYSPRIGKEYTIDNMKLTLFNINSKEKVEFLGVNRLRIYGSVLKLQYTFSWQKKQLGSSVRGTA